MSISVPQRLTSKCHLVCLLYLSALSFFAGSGGVCTDLSAFGYCAISEMLASATQRSEMLCAGRVWLSISLRWKLMLENPSRLFSVCASRVESKLWHFSRRYPCETTSTSSISPFADHHRDEKDAEAGHLTSELPETNGSHYESSSSHFRGRDGMRTGKRKNMDEKYAEEGKDVMRMRKMTLLLTARQRVKK